MNAANKLHIKIKKIGVKGYIILNNISFEVQKNEILTITGKNGSGKSTLLKYTAGILPKDEYLSEGEIFYNEEKKTPEDFSLNYARYVFQDSTGCFDPLKKMSFYFRKYENKLEEINRLSDYFKLGNYAAYSNLRPYELSGGMAQRLNIILALLAEPKVLLLDEPDSNLDSMLGNLLALKIKEYAAKDINIVIMVTQNLRLAEAVSDRVLNLKEGRHLEDTRAKKEFYA